ncbi:MAG: outer membrane beta-barrel protein, partial [Pseudomonadota bacterium]|nr:outer membrane beta-barrel protein [Pseudomonadota bacterium]
KAETTGRLDIMEGLYLSEYGKYTYGHLSRLDIHEELGNAAVVTPDIYTEMFNRVSLTRDLTRITAMLSGEIRKVSYENNETTTGTPVNNTVQNYTQYGTDLKVGYEMSPGFKPFIRSEVNEIRYETMLPQNQNSKGYTVDIGSEFEVTGAINGQFYIGYLNQIYDSAAFGSISGVDYEGLITWRPTALTKVDISGQRAVNETLLVGTPGWLQSTGNLTITHQLLRDLMLEAGASFTNDNYETISRTDNILGGSLGIKYFLNRNVALKSDYEYMRDNSTQTGMSYKDNRFTIGFSFGV